MMTPNELAQLKHLAAKHLAANGNATARLYLDLIRTFEELEAKMKATEDPSAAVSHSPKPVQVATNCPYIRSSSEGTSYCVLAEKPSFAAQPAQLVDGVKPISVLPFEGYEALIISVLDLNEAPFVKRLALEKLDAAVIRGDCISTSDALPIIRRAIMLLPGC